MKGPRPIFQMVMLCLSLAALGAERVIIIQNDEADPKRGTNARRLNTLVTMPGATFDYQAYVREDQPHICLQEQGDNRFGLSFGRVGNGGWNIWRFFEAHVELAGESFAGSQRYALEAVYLLERQPRHVVDFIWPLVDPSLEDAPRLVLRVIQDPAFEQWLFIRTWIEGEATIARISLSAYPGNTSGPPERRRMVGDGVTVHNLHTGSFQPPATANALALYNQYSQTDAGSLLVYDPEQAAKVTVAGTYGVNVTAIPREPEGAWSAAIGYFRQEPAEHALNRFWEEQRDAIAHRLAQMEWMPRLDLERAGRLLTENRALLDDPPAWLPAPAGNHEMLDDRLVDLSIAWDGAREAEDAHALSALEAQLVQLRREIMAAYLTPLVR